MVTDVVGSEEYEGLAWLLACFSLGLLLDMWHAPPEVLQRQQINLKMAAR